MVKFFSGKSISGAGKGASVRIHDVVMQIVLGMGIGVTADALVEISRMPVLNDTGTFGNAKVSNFELFFYGISIAGISAGIIDIGYGKGVLTFSRSMIFYLVGIIIGVSFYENTLVHLFNIRKFNPYQTIASKIPAVLPSTTQLPFIGGTGGSSSPSAVPIPAVPTIGAYARRY